MDPSEEPAAPRRSTLTNARPRLEPAAAQRLALRAALTVCGAARAAGDVVIVVDACAAPRPLAPRGTAAIGVRPRRARALSADAEQTARAVFGAPCRGFAVALSPRLALKSVIVAPMTTPLSLANSRGRAPGIVADGAFFRADALTMRLALKRLFTIGVCPADAGVRADAVRAEPAPTRCAAQHIDRCVHTAPKQHSPRRNRPCSHRVLRCTARESGIRGALGSWEAPPRDPGWLGRRASGTRAQPAQGPKAHTRHTARAPLAATRAACLTLHLTVAASASKPLLNLSSPRMSDARYGAASAAISSGRSARGNGRSASSAPFK